MKVNLEMDAVNGVVYSLTQTYAVTRKSHLELNLSPSATPQQRSDHPKDMLDAGTTKIVETKICTGRRISLAVSAFHS